MKRFWGVLLVFVLIGVMSTTGFALDVKFSGEFYAAGMYLDKTSLRKDASDTGPSTAFYFQRLRVRTDFIVVPGLTLTTRFDAMERAWGAQRSDVPLVTTNDADSAGTRAENENIVFDWVYVSYTSPIGMFNAGFMNKGTTGTAFGNNIAPAPRIKYVYIAGPVLIEANISKMKESSRTALNSVNFSDADNDEYSLEGIFQWKDGKAGLNITYARSAETRPASNYKKNYWQFTPYAMSRLGPVFLQAEVSYLTGKERVRQ
jgi:hypothetical protein